MDEVFDEDPGDTPDPYAPPFPEGWEPVGAVYDTDWLDSTGRKVFHGDEVTMTGRVVDFAGPHRQLAVVEFSDGTRVGVLTNLVTVTRMFNGREK